MIGKPLPAGAAGQRPGGRSMMTAGKDGAGPRRTYSSSRPPMWLWE